MRGKCLVLPFERSFLRGAQHVIKTLRCASAELRVLPTVLDLFFKYEWHNFLHNLVKSLLDMVITGEVLARFEI